MRTRCFCVLWIGLGLISYSGESEAADAAEAAKSRLVTAAEAVDLRPQLDQWELKPRSQGSRPTCSVFAFTGALEFAVAKNQDRGERLSTEFLNWAANQTGRTPRDGGFFSELWDGFASHGICPEPEMPYQEKFDPSRSPEATVQKEAKANLALGLQEHWIKKWDVKTGLTPSELAEIKQTLAAGWPVCGGFRWPKHEVWKDDVLQMCAPKEVFDGHSVLLVGYRNDSAAPGGGVFIFRNSSHGARDGYMPFAYALAYMNDSVWIASKPE